LTKNLAEHCAIAIGAALIILGLINETVDSASFFWGSFLILFYFFAKVPASLNSYFRTMVFRRDFALRLSFVVLPLAMFSTFFLFHPFAFLFLPNPLRTIGITYGFEIAVTVNITLVFLFIMFYSWRLRRYPEVAQRLWRKSTSSRREFEWDIERSKKPSRLSTLNRFISPGVTPTAIAVLLFLALLILSMSDLMLVSFLLLWLGRNALHEIRHRQTAFIKQSASAVEFFKLFDQTVTWEGMLKTGLRGNISGIWDAFVLVMCLLLLVIPSFSNPASFFLMFGLLSSWYLIIVLVQIMRRLGIVSNKTAAHPSRPLVLPLHKDLALITTLSLVAAFSFLMSYEFLEQKTRLGLIAGASLTVNAINLYSVGRWKQERERLASSAEWKRDRAKDRYRIDAILWFSGLPIALIGSGAKGLIFWTVFSGSVILLSLSDRILSKYLRSSPRVFASSRALYMALVVCLILGSAAWFFPELSLALGAFAVLLGSLLVLMWILFYKSRKYSLQKSPRTQLHSEPL